MTTGYLYDPRFLEHEPGRGIPELPARVSLSDAYLREQPYFSKLRCYDAEPAPLDAIARVHAPSYIKHVEAVCQGGSQVLDSADVGICEKSYEIALLSAGAALRLGHAVATGELRNAFGLIRPPGHHAEHAQAMGFCLFNNIAILAKMLQEEYGYQRIVIIDWDVHHGNGTQHSFEWDDKIFYVSMHQFPHYPGTGAAEERGKLDGLGTVINYPMSPGASDTEYQTLFETDLLPRLDKIKPDFVLISAGFDAHIDDPLAYIDLSTEAFGWMTRQLKQVAEKHADGRLVSLLEGGYNLEALPLCVAEHVKNLLDESSC